MKTLKIVTVKTTIMISRILVCFFLFGFLPNISTAQIDIENAKYSSRDDHKIRIYTAPFNLLNPTGGAFQLTAGKSLWKNGEVQFNIAARTGFGDPFLADNIVMGFAFTNVDAEYVKGTRVGLEVQQMLIRREKFDLYTALEGAISRDVVQLKAATFLLFWQESLDEQIEVNKEYLNFKVGMKFFPTERIIIDTYIGIGRKASKHLYESTDKEITPTLPWNIKFGYQI